nr:unnamed protein product [Callosobruchus analis]
MQHNLKRHQRYECGKEPAFSCDECEYRCTRRNVLVLHYKKKHCSLLAQFACDCGKMYSQYRNLYRHQKQECGKEPAFRCLNCDYKCFRRNVMIMHYKSKHHIFCKATLNLLVGGKSRSDTT